MNDKKYKGVKKMLYTLDVISRFLDESELEQIDILASLPMIAASIIADLPKPQMTFEKFTFTLKSLLNEELKNKDND